MVLHCWQLSKIRWCILIKSRKKTYIHTCRAPLPKVHALNELCIMSVTGSLHTQQHMGGGIVYNAKAETQTYTQRRLPTRRKGIQCRFHIVCCVYFVRITLILFCDSFKYLNLQWIIFPSRSCCNYMKG